jgi:hypothetical protein
MTHTDERVTRLLGELAERADGHVTPDRVSGVRSRARRTAAVRGGVVVAGLATAVAMVGGAGSVVPLLRGDGSAAARPVPVAAASPRLQVDLRQDVALGKALPDRGHGGAVAVVMVHVHGLVPARQAAPASPSGREHLFGLQYFFDGVKEQRGGLGIDSGPCGKGALARVDDTFPITVRFRQPGTYTVIYETTACPPIGTVQQSVTVHAS